MLDTSEVDDKTSQTATRARESDPLAAERHYGWPSRLRSYFIFDPLIWLYTIVMGILSLPTSLFSDSGRIQHDFARAWSWLIMKTILTPVKVVGLEKIHTARPHVYAINHGSAL